MMMVYMASLRGGVPMHMSSALGFGVGVGSIGAGEEFSIVCFMGK